MNRGDIYRVMHPSGDTKRFRLFVVVSRSEFIDAQFSTVVCAPIYTERREISSEVSVGVNEGLKHPCVILCDAITSLPRRQLSHYVGSLGQEKLGELRDGLRIALSIE